MGVTGDILALWRSPRATFRARLADGVREDRALALVMGAGALSFVAQWPALARAAHLDPSVPLDARLAGALMGTVFLLPLIAYGIAGMSHLVARMLGGQGNFYTARLALFWAMLAVSPLMLLYGAVLGLAGPGPGAGFLGAGVFVAFLWLWLTMLREAEAATWT